MKTTLKKYFSLLALIFCAIFVQNSNAQCTYHGTATNGEPLTEGYDYSFYTNGDGSISLTFQLLDQKTGLIGQMWWTGTNGVRTGPVDLVGGANQSFSKIIGAGQEVGQDVKFEFYLPYAGAAVSIPLISYTVGNNCAAPVTDTAPPTGITAAKGEVTPWSIELKLNGTDDKSAINYTVVYGVTGSSTTTTIVVPGASGVEKSKIIKGLTPNTEYTFNVTAEDASSNKNPALVNPNPVVVKTAVDTSNACTGKSSESQLFSPFSEGYEYSFHTETNGDVTVTFNMLDTKAGATFWIQKQKPDGTEFSQYAQGFGNAASQIISGLTANTVYQFAIKYSYAGGDSMTKWFNYTVGDNCDAVVVEDDSDAPTNFTAAIGNVTDTTIELLLNGTDNSNKVIYVVTGGGATETVEVLNGDQKLLIISGLTQGTLYNFSVIAKDAAENATAAIQLSQKTVVNLNTDCSGTSSESIDGTFSTGYTYDFFTDANDEVTLRFKFLDTDHTAGNAIVFVKNADDTDFHEVFGVARAGQTFSKILTGLTNGVTYKFAVKFEFEGGGLAATKYFTYTVGQNCGRTSLGINDNELASNAVKLYPNPANKGIVTVEAGELQVSKVEVYSILGAKVLESNKTTISTSNLQAGIYFVKIYAEGKSITKKLIVN